MVGFDPLETRTLTKRTERWALAIILAAALATRLAFFLQYRETPFGTMPIEDEEFYEAWARGLLTEGLSANPPAFHMSPFPAVWLAAIHGIFGPGLDAVRLIHGFFGVVNVALMWAVGRVAFGAPTGLAAAALLAVYAPAVFYEASLLPITLSLTAPLVAVLALARRAPRAGWREILAGLALGIFAFVRGNALLLVPVFAAWAAAREIVLAREARSRWLAPATSRAALLAAAAFLAIAPATLHNLWHGKEFILLSWHGGQNLYIGNHSGATGLYLPLVPGHHAPDEEREDAIALAQAESGRALSPKEIDRHWRQKAFQFVTEEPGEALDLLARKALFVSSATEFPDAHDFYYSEKECSVLRPLLGVGLLAPLAAAGSAFWLLAARTGAARAIVSTPGLLFLGGLAYAASVVAFFVFGRYRLPIAAFFVPFAAHALVAGWGAMRERQTRAAVLSLAAALAMAVLAFRPTVPKAFGLASAYYNVGLVHEIEGQGALARAAYEKATRYNARHFKSFTALARLSLARGADPREALEAARKAIEIAPSDPEAWTLVGEALVRIGRTEDARAAFRAALEAESAYEPARVGLARLAGAPGGRGGP